MALDTLDFAVLVTLALAVVAYFTKDIIFPPLSKEGGFLTEGSTESRDLMATINANNKNAIVFYGSQTGTAEDYANKLSKELSSRFGLKSISVDFSDYDFDNFDEISSDVLCFFLIATYGEGEPTDNAIDFFSYLENEASSLTNLKYTIFGLGNSTYEFYNYVATQMDEKFEKLGAQKFGETGLGDDGKGTLDEDFLTWKDNIFENLKNDLNFEEREMVYEPSFEIIDVDEFSATSNISHGEPLKKYVLNSESDLTKGPFDNNHPYLAPIVRSNELFNSKDRSCVHIDFDISGSNLKYSTGDHLALWPSNSLENIEQFNKAFGITQDKSESAFVLKTLDKTVHVPFYTPITYEAVIKHKLEISGPISRQLLLAVAAFGPTAEAKALAQKLGGDKIAFAEKIHSQKLNIADALLYLSGGIPWTTVPFNFIIEFIPHLQPRYYSISSSSLSEKTNINITAVVESEVVNGRVVTGVVTNLLKHIQVDQNNNSEKLQVHYDLSGPHDKFEHYKLPVHIRRSTFKLPSSSSVPIIMIGPGTGVAPFRGFVRERVAQVQKNEQKIASSLLFYGCRDQNDFLYKEEWPKYSKVLGSSFELFTAFSRQTPGTKVYVQDKLLEQSAKINTLLEAGAFVYVCGDASKMAREVQATLATIISKERGISQEKSSELIRSFKVQNRYQEDVW